MLSCQGFGRCFILHWSWVRLLSIDRKHPLRGHRLLGSKAAYNFSKFGPIKPIIKPIINVKAVKNSKNKTTFTSNIENKVKYKDFQINRVP